MTTTISHLPSDLVEEVLSRVPLKWMREVRLTCKKWNNLSKTQSFMKMHIRKASSSAAKEGESQMVALMGCNIYLTSIVVDGDHPSFEHKGKLSCPDEQVKISRVYHCEGLLLCILKDDPRFLVWNPYLREKRWIEPRYSSYFPNGYDGFSYVALGYEDDKEKSCPRRCVKLLRFIDYLSRRPEHQFFLYEMYDFDTGLWTTLDVTPHWRIWNHGVSLKGNTYWSAAERNLDEEVVADSIICFDFTSESFGQLLPLPFSAGLCGFVTLSCVREEKLAVLHKHNEANPYNLDIWITTKIEAGEVSWSKFLRIETEFDKMIRFVSAGFFIDEEKKIVMGFGRGCRERCIFHIIGDVGYFRKLNLLEEPAERKRMPPRVCAYVPSLLQIEQPAGRCIGKRQSEFEKLRYDEDMSRLAAVEANYKQYSHEVFVRLCEHYMQERM